MLNRICVFVVFCEGCVGSCLIFLVFDSGRPILWILSHFDAFFFLIVFASGWSKIREQIVALRWLQKKKGFILSILFFKRALLAYVCNEVICW